LGPLVETGFLPASGVGGGEAVTDDTRLLLCLLLGGTLETASVEATLHADGECVGNRLGDASGLINTDITKDDIGNIGRDSEDPLADGSNARVFMVEARHEGYGITAKVGLVVESVLRVEEALTRVEDICDESSTVFENETSLKGSSSQHVEEF